jgi:hypothetical protein
MERETPPKSSGSERIQPLPAVTEPTLVAATTGPAVREFKYLTTGDVGPGHRAILRPALPVTLLGGHGGEMTTARALVDSGADFTTFSHDWAELLAIDLERDCEVRDVGIADGRPSRRYVYTGGLQVEVVGERLFLAVAMFCKNLPVALLGRKDFFERYLVLLDQQNQRFFLERQADLQGEDRDGYGLQLEGLSS